MELILKNNRNIAYNVMTCLSFKDRYNLCITNKDYFENKFNKYKHQEFIKIKFKDYLLTKKWLNIKFKINLSETNITDISMLGNVHTLNLSHCQNITDVSMLGNVHTLNLSYCKNIKDVSMLGKVHTLNLKYCKNIQMCKIDNLKKKVKNLQY